MMNKRKKIALGFSVLSFPVMMFFQNCGQAGTIGINSATGASQKAASSTQTSGDTLVIDLPAASSGATSSPNNSAPILTTGSDSASKCSGIKVSDILLKINAIKADTVCVGGGLKRAASFEIVDADSSITLDKLTLQVKAVTSGQVSELFLGLEKNGNKILSSNNQALDLRTSDLEVAGFKVRLHSEFKVEAGKTYTLKFDLKSDDKDEDDDQCEVKPEFNEASIVASN